MSTATTSKAAAAWAEHAEDLAAWAMERLVVRDDAHGSYQNGDGTTVKAPLTPELLAQHFRGELTLGCHTTTPDGRVKAFTFDIDAHGPDADKEANRKLAAEIAKRLRSHKLSPVTIDSNGLGGFHVRVFLRELVDVVAVHWFCRQVVADLEGPLEHFPKQAKLSGKGLGNWVRLPGRHHKHTRHWTIVFDPHRKQWAAGAEACLALLAQQGDDPTPILEAYAARSEAGGGGRANGQPPPRASRPADTGGQTTNQNGTADSGDRFSGLLVKLMSNIAQAQPGQRHDAILKNVAVAAGYLTLAGCYTKAELVQKAIEAAEVCGEVQEYGLAKVQADIRDAIEHGRAHPFTSLEDRPNPTGYAYFGGRNGQASASSNGQPRDHDDAQAEDLERRLLKVPRTDTGNAERLVARHGHDLRYCHPWKKWLVWDGRRWAEDATAEVWRRATATARDVMIEASVAEDKDERRDHAKWSCSSENQSRLAAMLKVGESRPGIPILVEALDRDPWAFNCNNGTIDLRTGELRPHRRDDLITKLCQVDYDPEAEAPLWFQTLRLFFNDDPELLDYWNRLCGCFLAGAIRDHILPVCYGAGANGKSTILGALLDTFGPDYAMKAPSDLLLARKHDAHPTERADLFGKRLVMSLESDQGRRLNEGLVKSLTGGDQIEARRMFENFWRFDPTHTFVLATNHKPIIRGTDHGIWRRIKLIPFTVRVEGDQADKGMPEKLEAERAGILAYCVEGCLEWQRRGLDPPPAAVVEATAEYRQEQDVLGQFLAECTEPAGEVKASALFSRFKEWAGDSSEKHISQTAFGLVINERGIQKDSRRDGNWYLGLHLLTGEPKTTGGLRAHS